jgi:hypothetical protein
MFPSFEWLQLQEFEFSFADFEQAVLHEQEVLLQDLHEQPLMRRISNYLVDIF